MISFLLLILILFVLLSLVPLDVRLVYLRFFLSYKKTFYCLNFPLGTAFAASHKFWIIMLLFSFSLGIFFFNVLFWFLQWTIGCLVAYCSASTCLWFLQYFSCSWFLVLSYCGQKRCLIWFQSSYIYLDMFCGLDVIYLGECSVCTWIECAFCRFQMSCSIYIH